MTQEDIKFWESAYLLALRAGYSVSECESRANYALACRKKCLFGIMS